MNILQKILIVDNKQEHLNNLQDILVNIDAEIIEAKSGKQALSHALHHTFSIIILDVDLPDMNGFEITKLFSDETNTKDIPIILLTNAKINEQLNLDAYQAGAIDYIENPPNEIILISKILFYLRIIQTNNELNQIISSKEKINSMLITEISDRIKSEQKLKRISKVVENHPTSIIITNTYNEIEYINIAFENITEYNFKEVIGKNITILHTNDSYFSRQKDIDEIISTGKTWTGELQNTTKSGKNYWVYSTIFPIFNKDNECINHVFIEEDISLRKEYQNKLLHQTNYDDITGLPNRILALDRLNLAVATASRSKKLQYLIFIDLDDFKNVNKVIGFETGNNIIHECGIRISNLLRKGDTLASLGGDEFLIILCDANKASKPEVVAEKILNSLKKPFHLSNQEIFLTASIGITEYPLNNSNSQELIQNAEAAMYNAKELGGNNYLFFTQSMNVEVARRVILTNKLHLAIDNNELSLHYQPQIDLATKQVIGAEALIRWNNPEIGFVSPEEFIPIAESTGQIHEIGLWVMEQAIEQSCIWNKEYSTSVKISFNVSSKQLENKYFIGNLKYIMHKFQCNPKFICVEITENAMIDNTCNTKKILNTIKELGISISIDDFGTGYSSLNYLTRFPINALKIDRSFVINLHKSEQDAALCYGIIGLAHSLGHKVVAEGVENDQQLAFMIKHNCDIIQGYYFSKPLTKEDFFTYLTSKDPGR